MNSLEIQDVYGSYFENFVCFVHIHSSTVCRPISPFPTHSTFKKNICQDQSVFPNTLKCITSHWSLTGLPGAIGKGPVFLGKTDCLSCNIYQ